MSIKDLMAQTEAVQQLAAEVASREVLIQAVAMSAVQIELTATLARKGLISDEDVAGMLTALETKSALIATASPDIAKAIADIALQFRHALTNDRRKAN